jgi:putative glutamine amidotransferase
MLPLGDDRDDIGQWCDQCDGFLFTGGQDVDPGLYGEENTASGELCPARDSMEAALLDEALRRDLPVFGICRGIQFFNAHLGGTLYQDLPSQFGDEITHSAPAKAGFLVTHDVELTGPLAELLGASQLRVNSFHHQGVKALAPNLAVLAKSPDGLIEAVQLPDHRFALAVQWHPEVSVDEPTSQKLFDAFLAACAPLK